MKAIRQHHPDAHITLLTTKPFVSFAQRCGYFDDMWVDEKPKLTQPVKWLVLRKKLNAGNFSRVYDLQNNDRTSFYLHLLSPRPEWVGAARGASHRNTSPRRTTRQAFYGHQQTLALADIKEVTIDTLDWINTDISAFGLTTPYVLIVPGSAPSHPEKRWPAEHYIDLCKNLSSCGLQPVLIGTEAEKDITTDIVHSCPQALDLTGLTSLFDIPMIARTASLAIGNDTGPMHLIAPTGCPTLILFSGHSSPVRHAPIGKNVQTYQEKDLKDLSVKTVWSLTQQLLLQKNQEAPSSAVR